MVYVIFINQDRYKIAKTKKEARDILDSIPATYDLEIEHTWSGFDDSVDFEFAPNQHGINSAGMRLCKLYPPRDTGEGTEFDFYSVQYKSEYEYYALTAACFHTKTEAEEYLMKRKKWYLDNDPESWDDEEYAIVGQRFGKDYNEHDF